MRSKSGVAQGSNTRSAKGNNSKQTSAAVTQDLERKGMIVNVLWSFFLFPSFCLPLMNLWSTLPLLLFHPFIKSSFHPPRYDPIQTIITSGTTVSNPRTSPIKSHNKHEHAPSPSHARNYRDSLQGRKTVCWPQQWNQRCSDRVRTPKDIRGSSCSSSNLNHLALCTFNSNWHWIFKGKSMQSRPCWG